MGAILGCIADDFTGATDLANMLTRGGMRTLQTIGVPEEGDRVPESDLGSVAEDFAGGVEPPDGLPQGGISSRERFGVPAGPRRLPEADALVVALKSRTIPVADAIAQSLAALDWLRARGCRQFLFKYCSTFDSTDEGNIGPVAEALMERLGTDFTIACPAFPENQRALFQGYLFVGGELLSESPMRNHPLTPMADSNLVRVLQRQSRGRVGLVPYGVVRQGPDAIRQAFAALRAQGHRLAIADAVEDAHLAALGEACRDLPLVTGGSGIALGLPENFRRAGLIGRNAAAAAAMPRAGGPAAVIAGSCSSATLGQVAYMRERHPALRVDPTALAGDPRTIARAVAWATERMPGAPVLIYSSAAPEVVKAAQSCLGKARAAELVEGALAAIAKQLVDRGVRRLIVAGGETAGAVVSALGVRALAIGPQIDPGVPWTLTVPDDPATTPAIALALKSGNFGTEDFFLKALGLLEGAQQQ